MLSESLIKEFTNRSPSTKILVSKAWKSISLESKLEIIHAYHLKDSELGIPNWLMSLALDDEEEIVRILATYEGAPEIAHKSDLFYDEAESNFAKEIQKKLKKDKSEIIKNLLSETSFFIDLISITQDSRLINLRGKKYYRLDLFIESLERFTSEIPKFDLIDCLDEMIENGSYQFHYSPSAKLNEAWRLLPKLDEEVASKLARIIPIKNLINSLWNGHEVDYRFFLNLQPRVLFWALRTNRETPTKELQKAAKIITDTKNNLYNKNIMDLALEICCKDDFYFREEMEPNNRTSKYKLLSKSQKLLANLKFWLI